MKFREIEEYEIQQFIASHEEPKFLMITNCGKTMLLTKCLKQWQNNYTTIYINAMQCKNYTEFLNICKSNQMLSTLLSNNNLKNQILLSQQMNLIIIFKVSEKEAFDLFSLSKHAILIGISNDIEFLQTYALRYKFYLPLYKNLILKPYTIQQIQELVLDLLKQIEILKYDENAIKLLTTRAFNDKGGGDTNKITSDTVNQQIGMSVIDNNIKNVVTTLNLHQQIILLRITALLKKDTVQHEIDLQDVIRKVNEIKYKMSLPFVLISKRKSIYQKIIISQLQKKLHNKNWFQVRSKKDFMQIYC